jgi:hypothetical protein
VIVPDAYRSFFDGCASVAGALIGLLFVAISVAPHKLAGEQADVSFQVGAGAAFAALLNTLVVALVGLLPGTNMGTTSLILAGVGVSSVVGLGLVLLTNTGRRHHLSGLARLTALLIVFLLELVNGAQSLGSQSATGAVHNEAILCVALFVIAINQAWKLLDAQGARLFPVLLQLARGRRREP